jgi:transmembrane sensor
LHEYRPEARVHPDRDLLVNLKPKRRASTWVFGGAVVVALCLLVFSLPGILNEFGKENYSTTVDGYERIALADGSIVELNSNTEVTVEYTENTRYVKLAKGEAHFTVAKNKLRPFYVEANGITVLAVGTAFNVRIGTKDIEVLVTEGKISLADVHDSPDNKNGMIASNNDQSSHQFASPMLLIANDRASIALAEDSAEPNLRLSAANFEKLSPDMVRKALSWQGARLMFIDTPLAEVVSQFNRRNIVQIEIADPELGLMAIAGGFRADNVDGFVRLLTATNNIEVDRSNPDKIILSNIK